RTPARGAPSRVESDTVRARLTTLPPPSSLDARIPARGCVPARHWRRPCYTSCHSRGDGPEVDDDGIASMDERLARDRDGADPLVHDRGLGRALEARLRRR